MDPKTYVVKLARGKDLTIEGTGLTFEPGGALAVWRDSQLVKAFSAGMWINVREITPPPAEAKKK